VGWQDGFARAARSLGGRAARVVFPELCAGCGVMGTWLCADCAALCRRIDPLACCLRCGAPRDRPAAQCWRCHTWPPTLEAARAVYLFDGPAQLAVHKLKYGNERARAEWGGQALAEAYRQLAWQANLIVPAPLHLQRRRHRGYNQSELLARALGKLVATPVENALERQRNTRPQVGLSGPERLRNVAGAMAARRDLTGLRIVLIDDVATTGATLLDCARACRAAGASSVRALTLTQEA
jgi:ComF family protein